MKDLLTIEEIGSENRDKALTLVVSVFMKYEAP
jgi:hypothetical protein